MRFSLLLDRDPDGTYCAQCPELGLCANAATRDEASDKLTSLIMEWLAHRPVMEHDRDSFPGFGPEDEYAVFPLLEGRQVRLLCVPRRGRLN